MFPDTVQYTNTASTVLFKQPNYRSVYIIAWIFIVIYLTRVILWWVTDLQYILFKMERYTKFSLRCKGVQRCQTCQAEFCGKM